MLKFFAGFIAVLFGLSIIIFSFAPAFFVDTELQGFEWWSEMLVTYLHHDPIGAIVGLVLMVGGTSVCIRI